MFARPNHFISYKSMKRMTKDELNIHIAKFEIIRDVWNYSHTVLMDILNYWLNRHYNVFYF